MKTRIHLFAILLIVILGITSCASEERVPIKEIHSTYLEALNAGDIDSVMELFADNATFLTYENEILVGKANIGDYLDSMISNGIQVASDVNNILSGIELHATEKITFGDNVTNCSARYVFASGKITDYTWW